MKKLKLVAFVFAGFAFAMVSCSKGTTGPKGATGPAGPDSVVYSAWVSLNTTFNNTDSLYEQTIAASGITSTILDKGVILSYLGFVNSGDTTVFNISEANSLVSPISQALNVGSITIYSTVDYSGTLYRYVIIPGSIAAGNSILKGYTKEQLKAIDYATLSKALGTSNTKTTN